MRRILFGMGVAASLVGYALVLFFLIDVLTKVHELEAVPAVLVTGVAVLCLGALVRFD